MHILHRKRRYQENITEKALCIRIIGILKLGAVEYYFPNLISFSVTFFLRVGELHICGSDRMLLDYKEVHCLPFSCWRMTWAASYSYLWSEEGKEFAFRFTANRSFIKISSNLPVRVFRFLSSRCCSFPVRSTHTFISRLFLELSAFSKIVLGLLGRCQSFSLFLPGFPFKAPTAIYVVDEERAKRARTRILLSQVCVSYS